SASSSRPAATSPGEAWRAAPGSRDGREAAAYPQLVGSERSGPRERGGKLRTIRINPPRAYAHPAECSRNALYGHSWNSRQEGLAGWVPTLPRHRPCARLSSEVGV